MKTEADLTTWCRIQAPHHRSLLMRNNSGVLINPGSRRPIRFGLGNDSKSINKIFKSSDLIGITQKQCTCGQNYGIFTAIEVKIPGWKYNKNNPVHVAQKKFIEVIQLRGGIAGFVSSQDELIRILNQ